MEDETGDRNAEAAEAPEPFSSQTLFGIYARKWLESRKLDLKAIPNFPRYGVSADGEVWSFQSDPPKKLTAFVEHGSHFVTLATGTPGGKKLHLDRVVLEAWAGPRPAGCVARHLNGNLLDDRLQNLAWGSARERRNDQRNALRAAQSEPGEEWRPVKIGESDGYQVSSLGRVRSNRSGRWKLLRGSPDRDGYWEVGLRTPRLKNHKIHVLVVSAFHGERPAGLLATHLNGNNQDNRAENLAWRTPRENILDKRAHGTMPVGSKHHGAKLVEPQVLEILRSDDSAVSLAARFGVSSSTISNIRKRKVWRHLDLMDLAGSRRTEAVTAAPEPTSPGPVFPEVK